MFFFFFFFPRFCLSLLGDLGCAVLIQTSSIKHFGFTNTAQNGETRGSQKKRDKNKKKKFLWQVLRIAGYPLTHDRSAGAARKPQQQSPFSFLSFFKYLFFFFGNRGGLATCLVAHVRQALPAPCPPRPEPPLRRAVSQASSSSFPDPFPVHAIYRNRNKTLKKKKKKLKCARRHGAAASDSKGRSAAAAQKTARRACVCKY